MKQASEPEEGCETKKMSNSALHTGGTLLISTPAWAITTSRRCHTFLMAALGFARVELNRKHFSAIS